MQEPVIYDAIVVGSGAAGLMFAQEISQEWNVLVITKAEALESNTKYAQGGIAAVLNVDDTYDTHIEDTLKAGDGLCDIEAVKVLVWEAPARIRDLIRIGVEFDRAKDNTLLFTREGGHRSWRVLHVGDMTGKAIEEKLASHVLKSERVSIMEHTMVVELLVHNDICFGVIALDAQGNLHRIFGRSVFIATGGVGQLYTRTTNPPIATGDGIALASKIGVPIHGMEFIQFHPTTFYNPPAPAFLITEAVRGEGGILVDHTGKRFMDAYHPDAELAPRDIVSRAIVAEMKQKQLTHVLLDITHHDADYLKKRFPTVYSRCKEFGIDITKDRIPVAPAAHYCCGGIKTDIDGATEIPGLYAGGEVAYTGVHGANRLASNSLLESVVFAYRAAVNADRYLRYLPQLWNKRMEEINRTPAPGNEGAPVDPEIIQHYRERVQTIMWDYCGIVRYRSGLKKACSLVREIDTQVLEKVATCIQSFDIFELKNLLINARLVLTMALNRTTNAGTHYCINDTELSS